MLLLNHFHFLKISYLTIFCQPQVQWQMESEINSTTGGVLKWEMAPTRERVKIIGLKACYHS